jgi:hypothetical protein
MAANVPTTDNAPSVGLSDTGIITRLFHVKKYGFIKSDQLGNSILFPLSELIISNRSKNNSDTTERNATDDDLSQLYLLEPKPSIFLEEIMKDG